MPAKPSFPFPEEASREEGLETYIQQHKKIVVPAKKVKEYGYTWVEDYPKGAAGLILKETGELILYYIDKDKNLVKVEFRNPQELGRDAGLMENVYLLAERLNNLGLQVKIFYNESAPTTYRWMSTDSSNPYDVPYEWKYFMEAFLRAEKRSQEEQ
jgi:hypothetical protein